MLPAFRVVPRSVAVPPLCRRCRENDAERTMHSRVKSPYTDSGFDWALAKEADSVDEPSPAAGFPL